MATGVCGIDCTVCRLHRQGRCSSCGPGTSELAAMKIEIQDRLLGQPCPIIECAHQRQIDHCLGDCDEFPCERFAFGPYPFSEAYLHMQQRRREEYRAQVDQPSETVPAMHWDFLAQLEPEAVCANTGATWDGAGTFVLSITNIPIQVSVDKKNVTIGSDASLRQAPNRLALVAVVYLAYAQAVPLDGRWVSEKELGCASFFRGIHSLPVAPILERFGQDPEALRQSALKRGAAVLNDADAAIRLWILPKVPIILRLWGGDEEMPAAATVAFDASVESYLPADGIWALTGVLVDLLLGRMDDD